MITRPHGLKGHVLVRVFAQNPKAYPLKAFWIAPKEALLANPISVVSAQPYRQQGSEKIKTDTLWRVRLANITDRTAAETFRGLYLFLPQTYLPPLPPGHFYYFEAENAQVIDTQEGPKGTLQEIVSGIAYDFFVVRGSSGETYWIPAPFIRNLDKSTQPPTLWVEAPSGLWDPTLAQGRP